MSNSIIEALYEAAFVPERWDTVLDDLGKASGSASGSLLIFDGLNAPRWKTREPTRDVLDRFSRTDAWRRSERHPDRLIEADVGGKVFHCVNDLMTPQQMERDSVTEYLAEAGLGWQIGTAIPMSDTQDTVVFTFERRIRDGRHDAGGIATLAALHPHLARASLIASRLGIERARSALDALTAVSMPAALLDRRGRVVRANVLIEAGILEFRAGGYASLGDVAGDMLLQRIVAGEIAARSIALRPSGSRPARIAHFIPLCGSARDIFGGGFSLLLIKVAGRSTGQSDPAILRAVFDLSPAEARLASALATGINLRSAAAQNDIRFSTARSYLERIFFKTGCSRQSELVALLTGIANGAAA